MSWSGRPILREDDYGKRATAGKGHVLVGWVQCRGEGEKVVGGGRGTPRAVWRRLCGVKAGDTRTPVFFALAHAVYRRLLVLVYLPVLLLASGKPHAPNNNLPNTSRVPCCSLARPAPINTQTMATTPGGSDRKRSTLARSVVVNRRSHAKSRTGCWTCRRRRIKVSRQASIHIQCLRRFKHVACVPLSSLPPLSLSNAKIRLSYPHSFHLLHAWLLTPPKCDETKPSCRNCVKHTVTCDFVKSPASSASAPLSSYERRDGGEWTTSEGPPPQSQGAINMMDLELMHNFTTFTCTTMASDPAVRQLLRTTAVHMAVDCEYIMRSILAVSALHLSRHRPQKKDLYIGRAMEHHEAASSVVIQLMSDLKPEECERLHIFSVLTVYYGASLLHGVNIAKLLTCTSSFVALGCPVNKVDLTMESPLIPHWLRLLHGMEPILCMLEPQKYRGVLTPLFDFGRRRMQPFLKSTPPPDPSLLVDIQCLIHRTCTDTGIIPIYDDMIEQLRRILGLILAPARGGVGTAHLYSSSLGSDCSHSPTVNATYEHVSGTLTPESSTCAVAAASPAWGNLEAWDILIWQWTQGKEFLPLLDVVPVPQEAVAIFAYFLLVLKKLENQWWVEGWADHLMGKTWVLLDEEHRHWVGWATEEMGWVPPR